MRFVGPGAARRGAAVGEFSSPRFPFSGSPKGHHPRSDNALDSQ